MDIDSIQIQLNQSAQTALQLILGFVMFSIAIDTPMQDFRSVFRQPRAVFAGVVAQFIIFPAFTFLLVWSILNLTSFALFPSAILGMYLISACPGGNISNFLTHIAGGNTALSVVLSGISTLAAVVMTPFNFSFWASLTPSCTAMLNKVSLSFWELSQSVFLLLILPMILGLLLQHFAPKFTLRITKAVKILAAVFFVGLVVGALAANWKNFVQYIHYVALIVIIQNGLGLLIGYYWAKLSRLDTRDCRTISIEVGIQNSGLALLLALQFFPTLGGMALIAAWWSIWHAVSGAFLAYYWRSRPTT